MFRLIVLLTAGIFVTLQFGGRGDARLRDGLMGRIPPLMVAGTDAPAIPDAAPAVLGSAPRSGAAQPAGPVLRAAYTRPQTPPDALQGGLTLALPVVRAPQTAPETPRTQATATPPPQEPVVLYVQGSTVNVRQGPSADTPSLTRLGRGEAVEVIGTDEPGWSLIRIEGDGVQGYIASRFLGDALPGDGLFTAD